MKFILFVSALLLGGCACSDPRGCHPVEIGNTTNNRQLIRDGRDEQTYVNTRMPMPVAEESVSNEKLVSPQVQRMDDIEIDNKLKLDKVQK